MNDREFIELLNLYVDREISPEDALRLEAEVGTDQDRRRIYDQYCRMHKACSMLSSQLAGADVTERRVLDLPLARGWRLGPMLAGFAIAACIVAVFGLRYRAARAIDESQGVVAAVGAPRTVPDTMELSLTPDPMRSVLNARTLVSQPDRSAAKTTFAMAGEAASPAQLNWIGDIHLAPVVSASNPDFLLSPKADLKAGMTDETVSGRDPQEMAAFRFQR
jgi:hypothetical protein